MEKRQETILKNTVRDYIDTAEPVSSGSLIKKHNFKVSSATIRHELSLLEKEGYLAHMHTSSGRIPTDKGYRAYVDALTKSWKLPEVQSEKLKKQIQAIDHNMQNVLNQAALITSALTDCAVVALSPEIIGEALKLIRLILLDLDKILIVTLNALGNNKEFVLNIKDKVSQEDLNKISNFLNEKLKGRPVLSIDEAEFDKIIKSLPKYQTILNKLYKEIKKRAQDLESNLITHGLSKMIQLPDFNNNIEYARKVMGILEERKGICDILCEYIRSDKEAILIGEETKIKNLNDCSLVLSPYKSKETPLGALAVLGPKRMAYRYIVPLVKNVAHIMSNLVGRR